MDVLAPVGALIDQEGESFVAELIVRARSANARVVVAMNDVPCMDSAALEGLLTAADAMSDRAAALKLAGLTGTCREILEITGLAGRFGLFREVQDAVRSFL